MNSNLRSIEKFIIYPAVFNSPYKELHIIYSIKNKGGNNMVKNLTLENFEEEVVNSDLPVIIDFFADWCGPCQMMKPVFESVSHEYEGKMKFLKLDTQAEQALAMRFGIQGIPAFAIIKDGKEVGRLVGYMDEDGFKSKIDDVLSKI